MGRSLAVLQPHYIPWAGFFDLIGSCDDLVLLNSVQFSKNSFFNRNRLSGPNGVFWLTIPVRSNHSTQLIQETRVNGHDWIKKHRRSLEQCLSKDKYFEIYIDEWRATFNDCQQFERLADINFVWLKTILKQLSKGPSIHQSESFDFSGADKNSRLISYCHALGATTYRTGPKALSYLDINHFRDAGISIEVITYKHYFDGLGHEKGVPTSVLQDMSRSGPELKLEHTFRKLT
jgi:hypothetical protein